MNCHLPCPLTSAKFITCHPSPVPRGFTPHKSHWVTMMSLANVSIWHMTQINASYNLHWFMHSLLSPVIPLLSKSSSSMSDFSYLVFTAVCVGWLRFAPDPLSDSKFESDFSFLSLEPFPTSSDVATVSVVQGNSHLQGFCAPFPWVCIFANPIFHESNGAFNHSTGTLYGGK